MSSPPRLLVIMGSGETTPTMVTVHQRLLARVGPEADAVLIDTPYGFQENADVLTRSALAYFERHVGHRVRAVELRRADGPAAAREAAVNSVADADWAFAGPGSPSYALEQWRQTRIPAVLRDRLARPGVTVFASAAAVTLGSHALPVYEIYKVGQPPHWLEGLDLLATVGLDCVVIPHFDNAEGGTHDTRFCYLGERRLELLEQQLPAGTWILGVDEHTAAILDLDAGTCQVAGRGGVTVRAGGRHTVFGAGSTTSFAHLRAATERSPAGRPAPATAPANPSSTTAGGSIPSLLERATACRTAFDEALTRREAMAATDAVLELQETILAWSSDPLQSEQLGHAVGMLRGMITKLGTVADTGMHDHRDLLAPHVETLLELRSNARARGAYEVADHIRDRLVAGGVEVHDGADGTAWSHPEA